MKRGARGQSLSYISKQQWKTIYVGPYLGIYNQVCRRNPIKTQSLQNSPTSDLLQTSLINWASRLHRRIRCPSRCHSASSCSHSAYIVNFNNYLSDHRTCRVVFGNNAILDLSSVFPRTLHCRWFRKDDDRTRTLIGWCKVPVFLRLFPTKIFFLRLCTKRSEFTIFNRWHTRGTISKNRQPF